MARFYKYISCLAVLSVMVPALSLAVDNQPAAPTATEQPSIIQASPSAPTPTVATTPAPTLAPVPDNSATPVPAAISAPQTAQTAPPQAPIAPRTLKSITDTIPNNNNKPSVPIVVNFDKSLMFKKEDLSKARMIYNAYMGRQKNNQAVVKNDEDSKVDEILGRLARDKKELPKPPNGIYLNSILFRSAGQAEAWINGKKYEISGVENGIKLADVSPYRANIIFDSSRYDFDFNKWVDAFSGDPNSLPPNRKDIKVDTTTHSIMFSLHPNQRLDFNELAIKEGKPLLVKEGSKPADGKQANDKSLNGKPLANNAPIDGKDSFVENVPANEFFKTPQEMMKMLDECQKDPSAPDCVNKIKPNTKYEIRYAQDKNGNNIKDKDGNLIVEQSDVPDMPAAKQANFKVAPDGHFYIPADLNQQTINFKVDTGATITAISIDDAKKAGIDVGKLNYNQDVKLADGTIVKAAMTTIDNFAVGPIKLSAVNILVAQGTMDQPLLGMSFFNKLKRFTIEGDTLTLFQ